MIQVDMTDQGMRDLLNDRNKSLNEQGRRKFYRKASAVMYKDVLNHFEREEGPDGKWERWAGGLNERPTKRGGSKMLQDTGRLRLSITPSHSDEDAEVSSDV